VGHLPNHPAGPVQPTFRLLVISRMFTRYARNIGPPRPLIVITMIAIVPRGGASPAHSWHSGARGERSTTGIRRKAGR
jgi:hypothetical protein